MTPRSLLALQLIQGQARDGDHVLVDAVDGGLTFSVVEPAEPVAA